MEMTMTTEQREKYNEYQRNYRKNNPEKFKGYREKYKSYHQLYYIQNKEHMLMMAKKWREENAQIDTVYFFLDNKNRPLYIGSSHWGEIRLQNHLNNNSNIDFTLEELVDMGLNKIVYKDFTKYGLNRTELFFLEQYFKDQTGDKLSKQRAYNDKDEENLNRSKEELIEIANQENFIIYEKLVRYLN